MARLTPLANVDDASTVMFSVSITQKMADMLDEEVKRVGARSRAELGRLILEEYFKQEIEGE